MPKKGSNYFACLNPDCVSPLSFCYVLCFFGCILSKRGTTLVIGSLVSYGSFAKNKPKEEIVNVFIFVLFLVGLFLAKWV